MQRVPALDGLRGVAILLVIAWHYIFSNAAPEPGTILAYALVPLRLTWSGVDLFFVLSGFLIGGILMDTQGSPVYLRNFFVRRACRILPLYFAVIVTFTAAFFFIGDFARFRWLFNEQLPLWTYYVFGQNIAMSSANSFGANWLGITWSLAVEEQFYLLLPILMLTVSRRALPWALVALCLCAPILRVALSPTDGNYIASYVLMPCRADALLAGVLCARLVREPRALNYLRSNLGLVRLALALLTITAAVLTIRNYTVAALPMKAFGFTALALLYAAVLLLAYVNNSGLLARCLSFGPLRWLGSIAFGVYLFHHTVLGLAHAIIFGDSPRLTGLPSIAISALALAITLAAAWVSWRMFESPIVALGHRLSKARREVRSAAEIVAA